MSERRTVKGAALALDRRARGKRGRRYAKRARARALRRAWQRDGEDADTRCVRGWVS